MQGRVGQRLIKPQPHGKRMVREYTAKLRAKEG